MKKSIHLVFITIFVSTLAISCEPPGNKQDASAYANQSLVEIDTTLWLKEARGIRDIMEDDQGNLWFSSPDYIALYNGNSMKYFSKDDGLEITGNIHKDSNDVIWIENGFQIFRYTGEYFIEEDINNVKSAKGLWIQRRLDPGDTSSADPGIYEVSQQTTTFHPLPVEKVGDYKFSYMPSSKAMIGKDGTVWIGTMEKAFGYNDNAFISIGREEMGRQDDERHVGIRGMFVDSQGVLWMADNGAGLFTYDGEKTTNFTKKHHLDKGEVEGNSLHRTFSINEDSTGTMWFGTVYSGIWSYDPKTETFKNYTSDDGVKSDNIWMIYKTKSGELLFAGETPAAVYVFNGKGFERKF